MKRRGIKLSSLRKSRPSHGRADGKPSLVDRLPLKHTIMPPPFCLEGTNEKIAGFTQIVLSCTPEYLKITQLRHLMS